MPTSEARRFASSSSSSPTATRIVVATNDSPASRRAIDRAMALCVASDLIVVMAVGGEAVDAERMDPELTVRAAADRVAVDHAQEVVTSACTALGGRARGVVLRGDPPSAICGLAAAVEAEAIAVGSLRAGSARIVLRRTIAAELLRAAPCAVVELG